MNPARRPDRSVGFRWSSKTAERSGAVLFAATVAVLTASVILFGILKLAVDGQREIRAGRYQLQADALATAGLDRAIARLRQSDSYRGETWRLSADDLDGAGPADVLIEIESVSGQPNDIRVTAKADFPSDLDQRAEKTSEVLIHRAKKSEQ